MLVSSPMIQQFPLLDPFTLGPQLPETLTKQNPHNEMDKEIGLQIGSANLSRERKKRLAGPKIAQMSE